MSKTERKLSGIFFRAKHNGEYKPVAFEDLDGEQQDEVMLNRSEKWLKSLAKQLADTINELGEKFNIEGGG